jgi:hypothetical protein
MRFVMICVFGSALAATGWAGLIGTSVTGDMNIGGTNYFNPANGYVPAVYLNAIANSTTVTIANPGIEFGYQDGINTNTANFTDNTLTLTDVSLLNSIGFTYTFEDSAFGGLAMTTLSDSFPNGIGASLDGDTITLNFSGLSNPGTYSASYSLDSAAPEPRSLFLFGSALGMLLLAARKGWVRIPQGNRDC